MTAFFNIRLDLPHACTIAYRISRHISLRGPDVPPESAILRQAVEDRIVRRKLGWPAAPGVG